MNIYKKFAALALAGVMTLGLMAGCTTGGEETTPHPAHDRPCVRYGPVRDPGKQGAGPSKQARPFQEAFPLGHGGTEPGNPGQPGPGPVPALEPFPRNHLRVIFPGERGAPVPGARL